MSSQIFLGPCQRWEGWAAGLSVITTGCVPCRKCGTIISSNIHFILGMVILPEGYSTVHGRLGVPCPMESHMLPVCVSQYHLLVLLVCVLFLIRRNQRHVCGLPGSTSPGLTPYFRQCLLCYYCKLVFNFHISDNCCINRAFTNQNHPWPSSGRCHPTNFSTHELGIFNM